VAKASPEETPPLSEVKMTTVFLSKPRARSFFITMPTALSIDSIMPA
jgi:hypothetical protein